ncbi:MAG: NUDIX hydrolase [Verrucomicrobiales bacterium]|nr:NUDIX hydrolase [Verrucomicrobiales bacterium]
MKSSQNNPWITHRTEVKYDNPWIRVTHCDVTNPAGGEGIYGVVHFKNQAVGVIPVDDEGFTYLVGQYRYTLGSYEWEIPAGGCPEGENPENTARRELAEETGLVADSLQPLISNMALSNSVTDERAFIYLAENLKHGEASPEETEDLTIKRLPVADAIQMVLNGTITDSMSVAGLLRLAMMVK